MSLENCSLPRPGADLKVAGMKIPFSRCSLLLEPTRLCLCPWLAAQPGMAWRFQDVPVPAARHQDGPAGVQQAQPARSQPSKRALTSLVQEWEPVWGLPGAVRCGQTWTWHLGSGAAKGQKRKMASAGVAQPWMRPQTFLSANCFLDRISWFLGGFFPHRYIMLLLQKQE